MAANIDTVFVTQSLENGPNLRRLERELVLAFESGAEPVVVLTKADLAGAAPERDRASDLAVVERSAAGAAVIVTSSVTVLGVECSASTPRRVATVALIGVSGVGKSTLVNRLVGADVQATGEVRARRPTGRHTTTARELVLLPGGGVLVDTPGLRAVTLWVADDGLRRAFADIVEPRAAVPLPRLRTRSRTGLRGAGCRRAGEIDAARVEHYRLLDAELDRVARREEEGREASRDAGAADSEFRGEHLAHEVGNAGASASSWRRSRRRNGWPRAPHEQERAVLRERGDREVVGPGVAGGHCGRRARSARERVEHRRFGRAVAVGREQARRIREHRGPVGVELGAHAAASRTARSFTSTAPHTCSIVSSASRGSGNRSTRSHCSTDTPSTSSISRTRSFTRLASSSITANSSTATCSLRSSTSTPTMSAPIAPMREATRPGRRRAGRGARRARPAARHRRRRGHRPRGCRGSWSRPAHRRPTAVTGTRLGAGAGSRAVATDGSHGVLRRLRR